MPNTQSKEVNLTKRVQTGKGMRYCPVVLAGNGRVKPDRVEGEVYKKCSLVFLTTGCNPKLDFLDCLKAVAERAKLKKEDFWLHKFRATFATWSLWAGVDLRTVQQWLGHSDMESTMCYLKPSRSQQVREKVNEIFA